VNDATQTFDPIERASLIVSHDESNAFGAVVPPIVQTSLFTFSTFAEMAETYRGERHRWTYSRTTNPTVRMFEEKMAALEVADDAIGFASGMAAISGAVLSIVEPGERIVCVRHVYPDAYRLFETFLKRWNVRVTYVEGTDTAAVAAALPGAKLLYLESPTSWTMETQDLAGLARLARERGVITIADNSWATPIFQQPARFGIDLVIHSASKYIGGHSDTVAGVVAGRSDLIDTIRRTICPYIGAKLAPFDAWLLLRGLRTLPARLKSHEASGLEIARRVREHPDVVRVHHPALRGRLPRELGGTSGLFSFEFDGAIDIPAFCDALTLFKLGVSWGGHESLVVPALVTRQQAAGPNSAIDFGVPENMVRLHVGLEGTQALWADIARAIDVARRR
jgi:cystathionine beta-lyase/cystathionine gamma-synthase